MVVSPVVRHSDTSQTSPLRTFIYRLLFKEKWKARKNYTWEHTTCTPLHGCNTLQKVLAKELNETVSNWECWQQFIPVLCLARLPLHSCVDLVDERYSYSPTNEQMSLSTFTQKW